MVWKKIWLAKITGKSGYTESLFSFIKMAVWYATFTPVTLNFSRDPFYLEKHRKGEIRKVDGMKENVTSNNHGVKWIHELSIFFPHNGLLVRTPSIFNLKFHQLHGFFSKTPRRRNSKYGWYERGSHWRQSHRVKWIHEISSFLTMGLWYGNLKGRLYFKYIA